MELLQGEPTSLTRVNYYVMTVAYQAIWEERDDAVTKVMFLLLSSKNNNAKKDLCLAYSQGNKTAYPLTAKAMARYMWTQYPNKNPGHQRNGKNGD